ncbi:MAG: hypothetical protein A2177_15310 [Spirochaetes bacterium RBG_13_68_11]|nr:MAG: hypothetical protein A2177_15310 [Spirochaetes bacterium RBG_13_68_11]
MDPVEELARTIRSLPRVQLQNRLMRLAAREIAAAIRYLADADQALVFSALPTGMAGRVREEITLMKRRRLDSRDRLVFVRQVLASLQRETAPRSIGSYLRPVRRNRRSP